MPVPAGMMRNKWFPYNVARYLTFEERRAVKRGELEVLRDHGFEIRATRPGAQGQPRSVSGSVDAAWKKYLGGDSAASGVGRAEAPGIEIKAIEVCHDSLICPADHKTNIYNSHPAQPHC